MSSSRCTLAAQELCKFGAVGFLVSGSLHVFLNAPDVISMSLWILQFCIMTRIGHSGPSRPVLLLSACFPGDPDSLYWGPIGDLRAGGFSCRGRIISRHGIHGSWPQEPYEIFEPLFPSGTLSGAVWLLYEDYISKADPSMVLRVGILRTPSLTLV